jgi:hypothetical protein
MGVCKAPSPQCTREAQTSVPPTWDARRPMNDSSTRVDKPKMATPAMSSTPGE